MCEWVLHTGGRNNKLSGLSRGVPCRYAQSDVGFIVKWVDLKKIPMEQARRRLRLAHPRPIGSARPVLPIGHSSPILGPPNVSPVRPSRARPGSRLRAPATLSPPHSALTAPRAPSKIKPGQAGVPSSPRVLATSTTHRSLRLTKKDAQRVAVSPTGVPISAPVQGDFTMPTQRSATAPDSLRRTEIARRVPPPCLRFRQRNW